MTRRSKRKGRRAKSPAQRSAPSETTAREKPEPVPEPEPMPEPEPEPVPEPVPEQPPAESEPAPEAAPPDPPRPRAGLSAFLLHLHPPRVRRRSASPGATLGLGLATLVALAVATISGILLALYYVPTVTGAHASVQDLMAVVPGGRFVRNLHRWSAHAAVLFCALHMLRTLLWGAYRGSHRRVWLVGVGLLVVVIGTSFSGYLLPWDQDAYWTVTVGTSLASYVPAVGDWLSRLVLGGAEVGQATLTRFYMLHVLALPVLGLLLLVLHVFRLRRAGGLARPPGASGPGEELVPASPTLTSRELAVTLALIAAMVLLAALVDARLGPPPDLVRPDNPPKAPWFLVGLQEMVSYSAAVGGFAFPTLLLTLLAIGPWLDRSADCDGAPLPGSRARLSAILLMLVVSAATLAALRWWGDPQQGSASWLNPATIGTGAALAAAAAVWLVLGRRALACQLALLGLLAVLGLLTAVGWWYRGPDWSLTWHPGPGRAGDTAAVAKRLRPQHDQVIQITTPWGAVDRCPTCHRATVGQAPAGSSSPSRAHPLTKDHDLQRIGCTVCHGGQGRRLDRQAHAPLLGGGPRPFLTGDRVQARCARCHVPTGLKGAATLERGFQEYLAAACTGCHRPGRSDEGLGPDLRRLGRRTAEELRDALLRPRASHGGATMWSLGWRYREGQRPGPAGLNALIVALLAMDQPTAPFRPAWVHRTLRVDVDCATCHREVVGGETMGPGHRCTLLLRKEGLRCRDCHGTDETRVKPRPGVECPQVRAARPLCGVCHLRDVDGAPN